MAYNQPYRDQDPLSARIPSVPQEHPAKYAPELRNARRRSRGSVFCQSLLALPWFVFALGVTMLACSITWHKKFLDAAKITGEVLELAQVQQDSLLHNLWSPHDKIATATLAPAVIISLLVLATAAVQMATEGRRTPRGTLNSGWTTTYLGISGLLAALMWFVLLWTVVLLVVSVVWLLSSVVVNSAARAALRSAQSQLNSNSIDLQAPDTPTRLRASYNKLLMPLLTKQDRLLTETFLNSTIEAIKSADLSKTCRATCMDLTRFKDSLGTTACICDTKAVKEFLAKSKRIRMAMVSAVLCLIILMVAASLLLVIMVGRAVWARYALSFHSFRRAESSSLPMVLPPPPSPPADDPAEEEVFSIPSVSDPNGHSERHKMILWQQQQQQAQQNLSSMHRYDSNGTSNGRRTPQPPPSARTTSPYYGSAASPRTGPSTRTASYKPSQASSPRYAPSGPPSPGHPPTVPNSPKPSHPATSPTRRLPSHVAYPQASPATALPTPRRAGDPHPQAAPQESSTVHGFVSTRSPNFTFQANKSPTATSPRPHNGDNNNNNVVARSPAAVQQQHIVAMPPPYVPQHQRFDFARAHLEVSREASPLQESYHSESSPHSRGVPFDEPEPDVMIDHNRRSHFRARAAQAQYTGAATPGQAWKMVH